MVVLRNVTQVLVKASKPINSEGLYVSEVPKDVSAAQQNKYQSLNTVLRY